MYFIGSAFFFPPCPSLNSCQRLKPVLATVAMTVEGIQSESIRVRLEVGDYLIVSLFLSMVVAEGVGGVEDKAEVPS